MRRTEKSFAFWFLVVVSLLFFFLRLPSLAEPYWYGDEGIYQTIALALNRGYTLYSQIWDNKPPLLYYTYALFGGDQFFLRLLSLTFGLASIVLFFRLAVQLFQERKAVIASTLGFTLLFGLPTFEGNIANAENFMLPFSIAAGYLVYLATERAQKQRYLLLAGMLLGIAFLYKIVGIFDFAAFLVFFLIVSLPGQVSFRPLVRAMTDSWRQFAALTAGFVLPFILSIIYFLSKGVLGDYIQATFLSTVWYVGCNNFFLFPQGMLISKLLLLSVIVIGLAVNRDTVSKPVLFICVWFVFSLFNSFFLHRSYTHYLIVLIPSFALVFGMLFCSKTQYKYFLTGGLVVMSYLLFTFFTHWSLTKTVGYYANSVDFLTGQKTLAAYEEFFDPRTPRDSRIVRFILGRAKDEPSMFMWGNAARLYYQTGTLPPSRFTVFYHIQRKGGYELELTDALQKNPPQFIVLMPDVPPFPYPLDDYIHVSTIGGVDIYERVH